MFRYEAPKDQQKSKKTSSQIDFYDLIRLISKFQANLWRCQNRFQKLFSIE